MHSFCCVLWCTLVLHKVLAICARKCPSNMYFKTIYEKFTLGSMDTILTDLQPFKRCFTFQRNASFLQLPLGKNWRSSNPGQQLPVVICKTHIWTFMQEKQNIFESAFKCQWTLGLVCVLWCGKWHVVSAQTSMQGGCMCVNGNADACCECHRCLGGKLGQHWNPSLHFRDLKMYFVYVQLLYCIQEYPSNLSISVDTF